MGIFLVCLMIFILIGIAVRSSSEDTEREKKAVLIRQQNAERQKNEIQEKLNKITLLEKEMEQNGIVVPDWGFVRNDLMKPAQFSCLEMETFNRKFREVDMMVKTEIWKKKRVIFFNAKYQDVLDQNQINKLIREEFFLEMTEEMLSDMKGKPTSFSQTIVRGKLQKKFVYGKDWIVFENGIVIKTKQDKNKAI